MSKEICSNCRSAIQDFPEMFCLARKLRTKDGLFDNCCYFDPKSVFDRITINEKTLAEKLVYAVHYGGLYFWHSTLIYPAFPFETKAEAIAATVAKLKEVCDEVSKDS